MKYPDGQDVRLGDLLELWPGCHGTVVACLDDQAFAPTHPAAEWSYLDGGVLIETSAVGLVHYHAPEESFRLLGRAS
jgi:hypothetical protein